MNSAPLRVLVVEDEPLIAMVIEDAIAELGCEMVGPLGHVDTAMEVARDGSFDCAVLDVNICGEQVYPVADLLLARGTPFLLATGYGCAILPEHLVAQRRLTKPYTLDEIEAEIRLLCLRARPGGGNHADPAAGP